MRSRWFVADALLLWAGEWGSHRVLTDLRLDQGVETTRTEVVEMLLWEDMQAPRRLRSGSSGFARPTRDAPPRVAEPCGDVSLR